MSTAIVALGFVAALGLALASAFLDESRGKPPTLRQAKPFTKRGRK
ncbi:hypothetical protein [Celeribacter ethanolicus]|nr:hypothetical protein [Celeribacter ethanolicus]